MFAKEAAALKEILGGERIDIHHIGSTSVPGLKAKPIIDIMPIVPNVDRIDRNGGREIARIVILNGRRRSQ